MRWVKATLAGLIGGAVLATAILAAELIYDERSVSAQMADCQTRVFSDRTVTVCDSAMQVGGVELAAGFAVGFGVAFTWFRRATPTSERNT